MDFVTFAVVLDTNSGIKKIDRLTSRITDAASSSVAWLIFDRRHEEDLEETEEACIEIIDRWQENGWYIRQGQDAANADCYNAAMQKADSEFICFTNQHVQYDADVVDILNIAANEYPDSSIFSTRFRPAKRKFTPRSGPREQTVCEELEETKAPHMFPFACFFRLQSIRNMDFECICDEESAFAFLVKCCIRQPRIILLDSVYCIYGKALSRKTDKHYGCTDKNYYIPSLREIYKPMFDQFKSTGRDVPVWLQRVVYYQIYYKYYANLNLRNKYLLEDEEIQEFFRETRGLLQDINDELIVSNLSGEMYAPPFPIRNLFAYIKHDGNEKILDRRFFLRDGVLMYSQCGIEYDLSAHQDLKIKAFNIRKNKLCIDLRYFTDLLYQYAPDAIYAEVNGVRADCTHTGYYAHDKVFGESIDKSYTFYAEFPLDQLLQATSRICFYLKLGEECIRLPLFFNRAPSKLNNLCEHSYWMIDDRHALWYEDHGLTICQISEAERKQRERRYVSEMVQYVKSTAHNRRAGWKQSHLLSKLRRHYFAKKKNYAGRKVWLYFDKLFKAGDNGEYAFRYAFYNDKSIESYYVINKDAPDYSRLKQEFGDRILVYGSFQCMFLALVADTIVATHPDIIEFFGYTRQMTAMIKDLFNAKLVCIAHGVTIQKNADYQNRLFDNTMFYTTSSKYEVEHILKPIYGYEKDEVALTGMARFDGLHNKDQKQILITPTWRRHLVGKAQRNTTRKYSNAFKESSYYKIYNTLINDKRLHEASVKTGYRIIFLLHPSMSTQIDDYDRNDFVEIIPASGDMSYEKILTESSLMVTDYSGIHYDFGYMRKPVIYYQPKEIPMRFEEGGMKFETMGFGPVCTEYEEAVKLICQYMENQCRMPEEYKAHADDFFAFDDYNNCKRIHSAIKEWVASR